MGTWERARQLKTEVEVLRQDIAQLEREKQDLKDKWDAAHKEIANLKELLEVSRDAVKKHEEDRKNCTGTLIHSEFELCPVHDHKTDLQILEDRINHLY